MLEQFLNKLDLDEAISRALFKANPLHLPVPGCPEDEFDVEAAQILSRLSHRHSEEEVIDIVYEEFLKSFAPSLVKRSDFVDVGKEIYKIWMTVVNESLS